MAFELSLKGRTALVTGGARGIGAAICRQMAQAGAHVAVNYYDCAPDREALSALLPELRSYGVEAEAYLANVADENQVGEMVASALAHFGRIDILVNNAGLTLPAKFEEMNTQTWKTLLGVILDGSFFATRAVVPSMLKNQWGSIIMITTNCVVNGGGGSAAYPAAKAGVEGMVSQLVLEYADKGITSNIIRPSVIDTELLRQRYPTDEMVAEYGKKLPVGHVGNPEDISSLAVFLASDYARYICGESILVDGGRTYYKK